MTRQAVCKVTDLTARQFHAVQFGSMRLVLTLDNGKPLAIVARCPHQGADLAAACIVDHVDAAGDQTLTVDRETPVLRCPWHGFEFDLRSGDPVVPSPQHRRMRLRHVATVIDGDDVLVVTGNDHK